MSKTNPQHQFPLQNDKLQLILNAWGIIAYSFKPAEKGIEHRTVFVESDAGSFVLRIYRQEAVTEGDVREETDFMQFLFSRGFPSPELVPAHGKLYVAAEIEEKQWFAILTRKMPGAHISQYTKETVQEIGKTMAQMHLLSIEYCKDNHFSAPELVRDKLLDTYDLSTISDLKLRNFLERCRTFSITPPKELPAAVIHRDFIKGNLLFENSHLTAVLDFEAVKYTYIVEDIAVQIWGILYNVLTKGISLDLVGAFLEAYSSVRPLHKLETKLLAQFIQLRTYVLGGIDYVVYNDASDDMAMEQYIESYVTSEAYRQILTRIS